MVTIKTLLESRYRPFGIRQKIWHRMTLRGHFKVTKVKVACIVLSVAPMPKVPDKNVHHRKVNKKLIKVAS